MPGGDGRGPMGAGPMTGRGMGWCAGYQGMPRVGAGFGRFFLGRGRGRGIGARMWQNGYYDPNVSARPTLSKQEEAALLREEAQSMQRTINSLNDRIRELEKDPE